MVTLIGLGDSLLYPRRDEPRPRALRVFAAIAMHAPRMVSGAHEPTRAPALNLSVDRDLSTPFAVLPSHSPLTHPTAYISHPTSPPRPPRVSPTFAQPHHAARSPLRNPPPRLGRCGVTGGQRYDARAGRLVRRRLVTRVRHVQRAAGNRAQHDGHQRTRAGKV